jgi:hypothetical protein
MDNHHGAYTIHTVNTNSQSCQLYCNALGSKGDIPRRGRTLPGARGRALLRCGRRRTTSALLVETAGLFAPPDGRSDLLTPSPTLADDGFTGLQDGALPLRRTGQPELRLHSILPAPPRARLDPAPSRRLLAPHLLRGDAPSRGPRTGARVATTAGREGGGGRGARGWWRRRGARVSAGRGARVPGGAAQGP